MQIGICAMLKEYLDNGFVPFQARNPECSAGTHLPLKGISEIFKGSTSVGVRIDICFTFKE
jgi:hypothetical protein